MPNIHDRKEKLEPKEVEAAIAKAYRTLATRYHWLKRAVKPPYRVAAKVQRGYLQAKSAGYTGTIEQACLQILEQWNWKRSPAPTNLLESDSLWNGLARTAQIEAEEYAVQQDKAYQRAIAWLNAELKRRGNSPESKEQIRQYAQATLALEELDDEQQALWQAELLRA